MNDNITISTFQLFQMFPDENAAKIYIAKRRWKDGVACPECQSKERITTRKGGYYRCNACKKDFTVRTGTVFERSHIPLHKWIYGMYILMTARKGISSLQLSKEIGITQKSAWFMLHRIRTACGDDGRKLFGEIEVDEVYLGGKERNRHEWKRKNLGTGGAGKTIVLGMRERNGRTKAVVIPNTDSMVMSKVIVDNVKLCSSVYTDEHVGYRYLKGLFFAHQTVNHTKGEYANGRVTTNGIESVWAVIRRGIYGVYHHISKKHTGRYVDEFSFRLNDGNVKVQTLTRLDSLVKSAIGKRITYKKLIA